MLQLGAKTRQLVNSAKTDKTEKPGKLSKKLILILIKKIIYGKPIFRKIKTSTRVLIQTNILGRYIKSKTKIDRGIKSGVHKLIYRSCAKIYVGHTGRP